MKKTLSPALLIFGVLLLLALNSHADPGIKDLQGEYQVTGTQTCVELSHNHWVIGLSFGDNSELPEPCTPPGTQDGFGCFLRTGHISGTLRLEKDGTGTLSYYFARWSPQFLNGGNRPNQLLQAGDMGGQEIFPECHVVHGIDPSGEGFVNILEGCVEKIIRGGSSQWANSQTHLKMISSKDGEILILVSSFPQIHTTWRVENQEGTIREKICTRQFTAVRTSKK